MNTSRRGVGTLLIIVLVVVTSLFIMAMMQYFSSQVTRGKRYLSQFLVTDYMCEAALDEAVLWFKGNINSIGQGFKDAGLEKLHEQLVKSGKSPDRKSPVTYEAKDTLDRYKKLHPEARLSIGKVEVWMDAVNKYDNGGSFDTDGAVNFTVTAEYESTKKIATRTFEFRQVVVLPPREYPKFAFVALQWDYLFKRLTRYKDDYDALGEVLSGLSHKIYFGLSMLWYIVEPDHAAEKSGSTSGYKVGIAYAKAVRDAAKAKNLPWPGCAELKGQLDGYKGTYNNQNFNPDYLDAMSNSSTQYLEKAVAELKSFGFAPTNVGSEPDLNLDNDYLLSSKDPKEKASSLVQSYGGPKIKDWGGSNTKFASKDPAFELAKIEFKKSGSGSVPFQSMYTESSKPIIVVEGKPGEVFESSKLQFSYRPPPVFPPAIDKSATPPQGMVGAVDNAVAAAAKEDMGQSAAHLRDIVDRKEDCEEVLKEIDKTPEDYTAPAMRIAHPKTYYDWAFRLPIEDYQTGFKNRYDDLVKWKEQMTKRVTTYKDALEKGNKNLCDTVKVLEEPASATSSSSTDRLTRALADNQEIGKRKASYVLDSVDTYETVMKDVRKLAGVDDKTLVLNGVCYIRTPDPGGGSGSGTGKKLEIKETQFCGQGGIVAGDIDVAGNLTEGQKPVGNLLLWSYDTSRSLTIRGEVAASIMTAAPMVFVGDNCVIDGCLVVKDTPCLRTVKKLEEDKNAKIEELEDKNVKRYNAQLPKFKVKYPKRYESAVSKPHEFSQMTFTTYNVASAGRRGR